jgi:uncharacterized protein
MVCGMKKLFILIGMVILVREAIAQNIDTYVGPIIDMHLHAYTNESFWGSIPNPVTGEISVKNATEHSQRSVALLKKNNIVLAVVDGMSPEAVDTWEELFENKIIRGLGVDDPSNLDIDQFKRWVEDEKVELFGEIGTIYAGYAPADSLLFPFYEICQDYDIPVSIHTGGSFPGITERNTNFRLRLGDPFLVEDILVNFPKLRVYLMHAGAHFYERTAMLMRQYPNLYVDIAVLNWIPDANHFFLPFLKLAKQYHVLDRVMYGSDQMIWPEAIGMAIQNLQSVDFLTLEEKKDIFYNNAARFLRLSESEIGNHHKE